MSNQITPLKGSDLLPPNYVFFVKVNYFYVPFFNPGRDTILGAVPQTDETVVNIVDVQFDSMNNALCKCTFNPVADTLSVDLLEQYIMNIFLYIAQNITRLWGITITQAFVTTDDNFPDSNTTLTIELGAGSTVNPSETDAGNQVAKAATSAKSAITNALKSTSTIIIIILIVVVIGIIAIGYAEKEA